MESFAMAKNKKTVAVLTSGGDAPGMNPAVRAVVRGGIAYGMDVYAIYEGYQGLIENQIVKMEWKSVSGIVSLGGTIIGTARSKEFTTHEGILKAAENLITRGIDNLIVIGGDGSLTGAEIFSQQWCELADELVATGRVTPEQRAAVPKLRIVGMVGSIDNDLANSDMTIGADSALHRIVNAVDDLRSTAYSHQRIFIVEVMGRNCGYLAMMSGIATGASWVFIPESPPADTWADELCDQLNDGRQAGRRDNIIIIAEGARDRQGNHITSSQLQSIIMEKLHQECRITILGHVQRGGSPSAYDRYMSTAYGYHAIKELLTDDPENEAKIVVSKDNRVVTVPLVATVEKTKAITKAVEELDFAKAESMRGIGWSKISALANIIAKVKPDNPPSKNSPRIGVITIGHPASGMNSAIRTVVRIGMNNGYQVVGIEDGVEGLIGNRFREFQWMEVDHMAGFGGSRLGTNRTLPVESDFYRIAANLEKNAISGLVVIGGWTAYDFIKRLKKARDNFDIFNIPIVCIPATINNNMPGAEISIGCDTALNIIVDALDKIKTSTDSVRRLFAVEVMGRYCGYLAMMSGVATGAEFIYTHEMGLNVDLLEKHTHQLIDTYRRGRRTALIIRNENANPTYDIDFISALFEEEGGDWFDVRKSVLGPIQQGGVPTPFDRTLASRLAYEATTEIMKRLEGKDNSCLMIGQTGGKAMITHFDDLGRLAAEKWQRPLYQWWESYYEIAHVLAELPPKIQSPGEG